MSSRSFLVPHPSPCRTLDCKHPPDVDRFHPQRKLKEWAMKDSIAISAFFAAIVVVPNSVAAADQQRGGRDGVDIIAVYERATDETTVDVGAAGDSQGDMITFDNPVFDATTHSGVGRARGQCVRTAVGSAYECYWSTSLPGGSLMVFGPFFDAAESTLAITGGTGVYRNARGEMLLRYRGATGGISEYDFVFRVSKKD
jgi:allene oxide cyclase